MNDSAGNPATEGEMPEEVSEPIWARLEAFRKVNALGTERLAQMAVKAWVKRFIFISSVKVNGERFEISLARMGSALPRAFRPRSLRPSQ